MRRRRARWVVEVSDAARASIAAAAETALPNETGGLLIGWTGDEIIRVDRAVEVPGADAGRSTYTRSYPAAVAALDAALIDEPPDSPRGYVGEWHSHPAHIAASPIDLHTMHGIAAAVRGPVALVVAMNTNDGWSLDSRVVRSRSLRRRRSSR
jgi:proteasome lid subunit RPN8/RPN11